MKYKLKELTQIQYGKDHKKLKDGNIPVFGTGGLMRYGDNYLFEGDSVLIPRKGSLNNLQFITGKFWTVDTLFWTKIDVEKVIPKYLFYVLKRFDFAQMNVGSAVPSLTTALLNELEVEIPDINLQQSILDKINPFESQITNLSEINDNLLELADATFEKNYEQQVGNQKLETLATVKGGKRLPKGAPLTEVKTQHPYLRITDYSKNGVPSVQSMQYITEEVFDKISRYVINEGEVFLSIVGTIGIVDLIDERLDNASLTENAVKIHAQTTAMAHYLYLYLRSDEGRHEIDSRTVGTTQKKLAITRIKDFDVGVISETDLQEFERTVSPLINMVLANRSEIDTLVQIRDSLLQELI